ncbi:MAG: dockerin type I domain-containing protein [Planctomycetota bacterium]|nr:dockerin type I domain-containing protein [Planctomycetota bacterium]
MFQIRQIGDFGRCVGRRRRRTRQLGYECLEGRELLTLVISPGVHQLLPNTPHQAVAITVTRSDLAVDPTVTGFNLCAQLGDGSGPAQEPSFEAVDFGGGIWTAYATTTTGGPVAGAPQFAQASVVFNNTGEAVPPEGLVVTLIISTAGLAQGSYPLRLAATEIGVDSEFIGLQATQITAAIAGGTIQITARPWQNFDNRYDVNHDGYVTPLDALLIINDFNLHGSRTLPAAPVSPQAPPPYLDVSGDGDETPLDALLVINELNARPANPALASAPALAGAEGEPATVPPAVIPRAAHAAVPVIEHLAPWAAPDASRAEDASY